MQEFLYIFDALCGDEELVIRYFITEDPKLLWTEEEDNLLRDTQDSESIVFQILKKTKGPRNIRKRLDYLNLTLNFEI